MLQIIKPATETKEYAYRRIFRANHECHGFLCDESGNPIFKSPREEKVFQECLKKPNRYEDCGRVRRECTIYSPAIGKCECGRELILEKKWSHPLLTCGCGRIYDDNGVEQSQRSS